MDERTILRKAKGVLLERGWHQGGFCADLTGETGPVCLAGAVKIVVLGNPYYGDGPTTRVESAAISAIYSRLRDLTASWSVVDWNDGEAESIDDVIGLIDRALGSLPAEAPELEKAVA